MIQTAIKSQSYIKAILSIFPEDTHHLFQQLRTILAVEQEPAMDLEQTIGKQREEGGYVVFLSILHYA